MRASQDNDIGDFLLDAIGDVAEIDGPPDLAQQMPNVVVAARTSPAAQRAKQRRARLAAEEEIEFFLSALNKHCDTVPS